MTRRAGTWDNWQEYHCREVLPGKSDYKVKVIEPYQMLGEIDEDLRKAIQADVVGVRPFMRRDLSAEPGYDRSRF